MKKRLFAFAILIVAAYIVSASSYYKLDEPISPNQKNENVKLLMKANSPYLSAYANSNVNWYPWDIAALKKARKENKILLIDFGQLSCDVCVEKDKTVFEDKEIAKFINDNFIAIKVDLNERPDIYKFYTRAAEIKNAGETSALITVLALPDGRPFWLSDDITKPHLSRTMNFFIKQYYKSATKIEFVAEQLTNQVQEKTVLPAEVPSFKQHKLEYIGNKLVDDIDPYSGGLKGEEKLPLTTSFKFLLRHYYLTQDEKVLEVFKTTANGMIEGGLYDHIEGGFFSAAAGKNWTPIDFSKTLANNAQLISLYSEAYQQTKDPYYKDVVYETLEFLEKRLLSPSGAFYAGLQGHVGHSDNFYTWTKTEVEREIQNQLYAKVFCDYFNISNSGAKNNLFKTKSIDEMLRTYGLSKNEFNSMIASSKQKLLKARNRKVNPVVDEQIITAWNALMLRGYVDAYRAFGNYLFLERANNLANFLAQRMHEGENLAHCMLDGKVVSQGFLDDYAYSIEAFIEFYQATFDEKWLYHAKTFGSEAVKYFYNVETEMFLYTSVLEKPFLKNVRFPDEEDQLVPSANSSIARGMYVLSLYFGSEKQGNIAKNMMLNMIVNIEKTKNSLLYANWYTLYNYFVIEPFEVTIVGNDYEKLRSQLDDKFLPNVLLLGGKDEGTLEAVQGKLIEGETMIYVCKNKVCKMPTNQVSEALELMVSNAN